MDFQKSNNGPLAAHSLGAAPEDLLQYLRRIICLSVPVELGEDGQPTPDG